MRGPETVKKMEEGDSRLNSAEVGNPGKIHNFLNTAAGKKGKTRLAGGIHITVIPKNGECMSCHTSCTNVKNTRQKFSGNFIHVRYHQQ